MMAHGVFRARSRSHSHLLLSTIAAVAAATLATSVARAADGPGCEDAGIVCADNDSDGFAACGCTLSGTPCDCNDSDPGVFPGAPERCDGLTDTNCTTLDGGNGVEPCAAGKGCFQSVCVDKCIPQDDFGCPAGSNLSSAIDGGPCLCVPRDCTVFGCPPGSSCDENKSCVPTCNASVRCPYGERCRGFGCVDPCAGVACPAGGTCRDGHCMASCGCPGAIGCAPSETCDLTRNPPACVESACVGVSCAAAGTHCEKGVCIDDCKDVVCPPKLVCKLVAKNGGAPRGRCTDLCSPDPCTSAFECDWRNGGCLPRPTADGGLTLETVPGADLNVVGGGWIVCSFGLGTASMTGGLVVGVALLSAFVARRRRRREHEGSDSRS